MNINPERGATIKIPIDVPEGYEKAWICSVDTTTWEFSIATFCFDGDAVRVTGRNYYSSSISFKCTVSVACLKK